MRASAGTGATRLRIEWVASRLAVIGSGLYLSMAVALYALQTPMIYLNGAPHRHPDEVGLPQVREETIRTSDGESLVAWWSPPKDRRLVVLDLQGQGGGPSWRADRIRHFIDAGYGILTVAYRGFAGSTGEPSEHGLTTDALAAYRWLLDKGYAGARIVVFGESLGSGVAVQLAARVEAAAVVLDSPFTSLVEVAQARFPLFPARWIMRDRFDSLARIGELKAPLLVVHGDRDAAVPYALGKRLYEAAGGNKRMVTLAGGGHTAPFDEGPWAAISAFLDEVASGAAQRS